MNVFTSGSRHQPWVWQVTFLCFVLGILLAGSLQTVNNIHRSGVASATRPGGLAPNINTGLSRAVRDKDKEIASLREQNTQLQNTMAQGDGQSKMLNQELQKMKLLAGLTEVKGPGIILTLQDSPTGPPSNRTFEAENYLIHDWTIQRALHELNASGAEALSINGQRVTSRTPVRCVGPTAMINNVPTASPYEIKAIGDPNTLAGGLTIRDGFADSLRSYDPRMVKIEKKQGLAIPAYTGSTEFRYATPVTGSKSSGVADKTGKGSETRTAANEEKAG
jgi:uncharacterized protein YlxW (UPF0749 family)